jgi:hypothetical protein
MVTGLLIAGPIPFACSSHDDTPAAVRRSAPQYPDPAGAGKANVASRGVARCHRIAPQETSCGHVGDQPKSRGSIPEMVMAAMSSVNRSMTPLEWGLLVMLSMLWGGSFFFVGVAIKELPPLTIVMLRVALAAPVLLAISQVTGVRLPGSRAAWTALVGMAVLNNVAPFVLIV